MEEEAGKYLGGEEDGDQTEWADQSWQHLVLPGQELGQVEPEEEDGDGTWTEHEGAKLNVELYYQLCEDWGGSHQV